ncbi:sensor histidine kinase [Nonomuraea soli]|uniref:histidine kinase n=1 Tax=Nonomuraea soli TaxID=1032476 RepID=A0A7W0HRQ7_9ACTN|nr:nitrate- and nitrite sensing domain-containing protein [Nonomuraea soli]MBA2893244.1 signal transduction histidine kinase [Nonomuraea soli]
MRARLVALILVPTAAAVLLGGVQLLSSSSAAADYARTSRLAQLSSQTGLLVHRLAEERARVAWFIALGRPSGSREAVERQRSETDAAVLDVRDAIAELGGDVTGRTADEVEAMTARLDDLTGLRRQAFDGDLLPAAAIDSYGTIVKDLLTIHDEVSKGATDDALFRQTRVLHSLALAKESFSIQQALITTAVVAGRIDDDQLKRLLGELATEQNERRAFAAEATADERRVFDEKVSTRAADQALFLRELVLTRATAGVPLDDLDLTQNDDPRQWFEASKVIVDSLREVETAHAAGIVLRSEQLSSTERGRAMVVAVAVLALLVAVLLITTGVARSLVRPLRRLRRDALEVAGRRLPDFVQRLREGAAFDPAMLPAGGHYAQDEVGEVARAFDEVHREAVRLAGEEARLRSNVNAMFVNLSRRSQTLVERQLTLIERLERGERDDTRLGDLFKLDHLATRMRRNSENLLVLAGQETSRKWSEPVELLDVVRAALGEVDGYDRVSVQIQSDVAIAGQAVNDVVHLLAELIENAVSFSRHDSRVSVTSNRVDGGSLMLSVTDHGIGMSAEELAQANWRLANPPVVDVSIARRMGLFVVGRLALRHQIRVQLRQQDVGGLAAMVLLPDRMLTEVSAHVPPAPPISMLPPDPFGRGHPSFDHGHPSFDRGQPSFGHGHPSFDPMPTVDTLDRVESAASWFTKTPSPSDYSLAEMTGPLERVETGAAAATPELPEVVDVPVISQAQALSMEPPPTAQEEPPSSWFVKSGRPSEPQPQDGWRTPEPGGAMRTAEVASQPLLGGTTSAGLPRRTPKANLVPGTAAPEPASRPSAGPVPPVSPDELRDRFSNFQQGVRKGRAEIEEEPQ